MILVFELGKLITANHPDMPVNEEIAENDRHMRSRRDAEIGALVRCYVPRSEKNFQCPS